MTVQYLVGDTRDVIAGIPDATVNLVASSPPFLGLRSYLPAGHHSKHNEIGAEPGPAEFVDNLLAVTADWARVLTPHGSIAIELGDAYSGSGGSGGDYNPGGPRAGQPKVNGSKTRNGNDLAHAKKDRYAGSDNRPGWPLAKSLALIPQLFAVALVYGINPLTGQPSPAGRWRVRNIVVWHRPNPPVGRLADKVKPSTSYITIATRSKARWFDLDAVRHDPVGGYTSARAPRKVTPIPGQPPRNTNPLDELGRRIESNTAGAPPLDYWTDEYDFDPDNYDLTHDTWTINTQPSTLAHYAMWPAKLAERLILSMCPGPGTVLDPFAGTGTTLAVADLHGRHAIGIDIDPRNHDLYPARYDECKRALFGTLPELPGQTSLFEALT